MQLDFHYYATYCAAFLSGYSHEESIRIAYCAQFVDNCSRRYLARIKGPRSAASTQTQIELADAPANLIGLQDIVRIWAPFHFLPYDLYAPVKGVRSYKNKYRLICRPNGALVKDTVELAKGRSLEAAGVAMHVLADTWAHSYFAGVPSLVINNTNDYFYEILPGGDRKVNFRSSVSKPDDPEKGDYTGSLFQPNENSIMNLGHGRAGHFPDYSYARYKYMPAWADYDEIVKDNPSDYMHAFRQMVYAMKYLRGEHDTFTLSTYDTETVSEHEEELMSIITKRQTLASNDWKAFGEKLSGREIPDFDVNAFADEYMAAAKDDKDETVFGRFILAVLAQKSMVVGKIFSSGNLLAGFSVDYSKKGFRGIQDFAALIEARMEEMKK